MIDELASVHNSPILAYSNKTQYNGVNNTVTKNVATTSQRVEQTRVSDVSKTSLKINKSLSKRFRDEAESNEGGD